MILNVILWLGGTYICTADNRVGPPVTATIDLDVICKLSHNLFSSLFDFMKVKQSACFYLVISLTHPDGLILMHTRALFAGYQKEA